MLFLASVGACTRPSFSSAGSHTVDTIKIGYPESSFGDASDGLRQVTNSLTLEGLTSVSRDGRAEPRIAESWRWENDGLALRLKLRDHLTDHRARSIGASEVKNALEKAVSRGDNQILYWSLTSIKRIETDGSREIVIHLSRPAGELPQDLSLPLSFGVEEEGSGPFKIVSDTRQAVDLERVEAYHSGVPQIKRVEIRPYETLRTAWAGLLRGEIDLVTTVSADVLEFFGNEQIQVSSFLHWYQYVIAFNSSRPPFSSPLVRRALNLAVDRNSLIAQALKKSGRPATGPLWPEHWTYDDGAPQNLFDPAAAESLLDAAGFPRVPRGEGEGTRLIRFSFSCLAPANFATDERIALQIQKQLYDIGVDVQFETIPAEAYSRRLAGGDFEAVLTDLIAGPTFGRPYMFWASTRTFKGFNVFGYENPEADQLFTILRESNNEAVVRTAARRLHRVMLDDPPALFLAWRERSRAISRQFDIPQEPGRDPLSTLWRWTPRSTARQPAPEL